MVNYYRSNDTYYVMLSWHHLTKQHFQGGGAPGGAPGGQPGYPAAQYGGAAAGGGGGYGGGYGNCK